MTLVFKQNLGPFFHLQRSFDNAEKTVLPGKGQDGSEEQQEEVSGFTADAELALRSVDTER